ncbi:DUF262 domain-containing protein [Fusobacterium ulcerans]|uniref:DUF262 domain-containing protein n=1 Tax=Fusobacterium ulcerans TaxID=861 RepID=UPI0027BB101B|nr:DUF262 domain-containing protein [Fusobacterium ulcerans]
MKEKLFELGRLTVVDLYDWNNREILKYESYFQRQAAWKLKDREFLIDSIVKGLPLPSIFICDASMDYDLLRKQYNVLDGRQRLESIFKFLKNEFKYNDQYFREMQEEEKDRILSFSIPIVQIYIQPTDVEKIKEIFKRLNTNSRNLNKIEKDATRLLEYDFMLLNKVLANIINIVEYPKYKEEIDSLFDSDLKLENVDSEKELEIIIPEEEVKITDYISEIIKSENIEYIQKIFTTEDFIFSKYFIGRQVHLQHLLNILGSIVLKKIIHRNLTENEIILISDKIDDFNVKEIVISYNKICEKIYKIYSSAGLDKFWVSKTNLYSFSYLFMNRFSDFYDINESLIVEKLNDFKLSSSLFGEYNRWAQEKVNDKSTRERRNEILEDLFFPGKKV